MVKEQTFVIKGTKIYQRYGSNGLETTISFTMILPKYILNANDSVKKRVVLGVREYGKAKSKPTKEFEMVTHTTSREGLGKETSHGTIKVSIKYDGFFSKAILNEVKNIRKDLRKLYKEISLFPEG